MNLPVHDSRLVDQLKQRAIQSRSKFACSCRCSNCSCTARNCGPRRSLERKSTTSDPLGAERKRPRL